MIAPAAATAAPCARKFDPALHAKRVQLSLYCLDERFRFSELLDCHDARVERRRWLERVGNGKAEANLVTANVESFSGKRQHIAIMIGRNPQTQTSIPFGKSDQAPTRRKATD